MLHSLISKFAYMLRSRIRFARYNMAMATKSRSIRSQTSSNQSFSMAQHNPHPVTLGQEHISRFYNYVANRERISF